MRGNLHRLVLLVACIPLLVPLTACAFAADLVNPAFLSVLGFDPDTVIPPEGRVLVTFDNETSFTAAFVATAFPDALDTTDVVTLSATDVAANSTRTLAVDCPIDAVLPQLIGVLSSGGLVELAYDGEALFAGSDFLCGDVIVMRVVPTGGVDAFGIDVEVLPGR